MVGFDAGIFCVEGTIVIIARIFKEVVIPRKLFDEQFRERIDIVEVFDIGHTEALHHIININADVEDLEGRQVKDDPEEYRVKPVQWCASNAQYKELRLNALSTPSFVWEKGVAI